MSYFKSVFKWMLHAIERVEDVICFIGLVTCTLLIFVQVVNRYLLHFEIMWFGDLAVYTFIFFMLIAAPLTTWKEGHISVDFFRESILGGKPRGLAIHGVFMVIISIAVGGVFFPITYKFMREALKYPEYSVLVPWLNTSWLQETLFIMMALVLMHLLVIARRDIVILGKNLRSSSGSKK